VEVVAALAKQAITITPSCVATIKAKHNKKRRVVKKAVAKGNIGIPEIKAAPALLKLTGGVAVRKIREIVLGRG
jgi:hypothetical protein